MIHLEKQNQAPQALLTRGSVATQQDCDAYEQDHAAYVSGERKFEFNDGIYGSAEIRRLLKEHQHNKCCYCESKPFATSAGRIDHFRPKSAVRQGEKSDRLRPGYYWLAYRWDNLMLACETCNNKKSDYFPLQNAERRARSHHDALDEESPLLLNPYVEMDLREHLTFDGSACRPASERGRVTVSILGLNRPDLQDERQRVLTLLERLCSVMRDPNGCDALRRDARDAIDPFTQPDAPYSAMARDYLRAAGAEI